MAKEKYICRKCGFEFSAVPGQEEPPDCPECKSDEIEKLERSSLGTTGSSCGGQVKNPRFS
jgi:DNA-directed RNA polymerase subunit RPC12/RpoP